MGLRNKHCQAGLDILTPGGTLVTVLVEKVKAQVVFKSPVQSGFWTLIRCNRNRNRLGLHPQFRKTGLNHIQPVQIGPVVITQPI